MNMNCHDLSRNDIQTLTPMFAQYFNENEGTEWTAETAARRLSQVITREDSFGLVAEDGSGAPTGFVMGYYEQYSDGMVYDLVEILVRKEYQGRGIGTALVKETERRAKEAGAILVQLTSVNDDMHEHFYGKLGYLTANNLTLKSRVL